MSELTKRIEEAIEAGEVLLVKYAGGSQPGVPRRLVPIQLLKGDKLRARCVVTNKAKIFLLSKIEVMDAMDHGDASYQPPPARPKYENLHEALSGCREKLEEMGWEIHERLELCRYDYDEFESLADIELIHNMMSAGVAIGINETGQVFTENVETPKPWRLQCKSAKYSGSFSSLDSAIEKLLILATKPNPGGR